MEMIVKWTRYGLPASDGSVIGIMRQPGVDVLRRLLRQRLARARHERKRPEHDADGHNAERPPGHVLARTIAPRGVTPLRIVAVQRGGRPALGHQTRERHQRRC